MCLFESVVYVYGNNNEPKVDFVIVRTYPPTSFFKYLRHCSGKKIILLPPLVKAQIAVLEEQY